MYRMIQKETPLDFVLDIHVSNTMLGFFIVGNAFDSVFRSVVIVSDCVSIKVSRKFFLKHNKSFRRHLGDYEKHNLFPFEGL